MSKTQKVIIAVISVILSVAIIFGSVTAVFFHVTSGERVDCAAEVETLKTSAPDTSSLYTGMSTKDGLKADLDELDKLLASLIGSLNIDTMLYTDEIATMVAKYTAILTEKEFASIKFKALKKQFPDAYAYVKEQKEADATWDTIGTIPFGITAGDKEAFIKACGAGAEHLGNSLLKVILYAPNSYYDALVPALESTHTDTMPSLIGFVKATGLSGSKRISFLAEKILAIIEPTKAAPLTYLLDILPDFLVSYGKSTELLNSNKKITEKVKLQLPTVDSIVSGLVKALGMTAPALDFNYLATLSTATVGESGGNKGERVVLNGDREALFLHIAKYIVGLFTYENNYAVVEDIVLSKVKNISSAELQSLIYSQSVNDLLACLLDILAKNADTPKDVEAEVQAYNAQEKDFSSLFGQILTEENLASALDSLESTLAPEIQKIDFNSLIFTDKVATVVSKFTAELCGMEFAEINFAALKKSFPDAYNYVAAEQAAGKTWADIDTIPFGITVGDKDMFIKACGAGGEHFGDALALCIMVSPTSYDDGLIPLLEAFHTGEMPDLKEFVASSGLDGAKRMEDLATKILSIIEPLKAAPLSYLCEILPDIVMSYNKMAEFINADANIAGVGLHMKSLDELLGGLVSSLNITLLEYDLLNFAQCATAKVENSGDNCSKRMALYGDREVVFMTLVNYVVDIAGVEGNIESIINLLSDVTGIDLSFLITIINTVEELFASLGL